MRRSEAEALAITEIKKVIRDERISKTMERMSTRLHSDALKLINAYGSRTPNVEMKDGKEKFNVYLEKSADINESNGNSSLSIRFDKAGLLDYEKSPRVLYSFDSYGSARFPSGAKLKTPQQFAILKNILETIIKSSLLQQKPQTQQPR